MQLERVLDSTLLASAGIYFMFTMVMLQCYATNVKLKRSVSDSALDLILIRVDLSKNKSTGRFGIGSDNQW